ncbi:MAG: exonuclease [Planctomycetes bacterium]|nr:exonuclease [Planctomycetota bacterium]
MSMLKRTFLHIHGIGRKTEGTIWQAGIHTWDDFLGRRDFLPLPELKRQHALDVIAQSVSALEARDARFFANCLPSREAWRAYPAFRHSCVFIDIETTGLPSGYLPITCIGLYDGSTPRLFVKGFNLDSFRQEILGYKMIVTYNGATFDLPFIRAWFPDIQLPPLHLDLRYVFHRLGYQGGLKDIEGQVGIERRKHIRGMDGFDAARLWHEYERGDVGALRRMLEYNLADIVNLKELAGLAYNKMLSHVSCGAPEITVSRLILPEAEIAASIEAAGI